MNIKKVQVYWTIGGVSELVEDTETGDIFLKLNIYSPTETIFKQINEAVKQLVNRFEKVKLVF